MKTCKSYKSHLSTVHFKVGTLMNAENADFSFLSAKISAFQRPKGVNHI